MLTLYHGRTSVCSVKVRLALAEKGVAFDSRILTLRGDQFEPEYLKLNPNAVVPTLVHVRNILVESTVIAHYVDEAFSGPPLMPAEPLARAKVRLIAKFIDEFIHAACVTLTFATANRARLSQMTPDALAAELAKAPDPELAEIKRDVVTHGLDSPLVAAALRRHVRLLDCIEAAVRDAPYIAGPLWSLADAALTPYVWRLANLKLARMWENRPGVAAWYDRIQGRPSFRTAVDDWINSTDIERYLNQPDPWPKVRDILAA
jgi:glutathione S-transferase